MAREASAGEMRTRISVFERLTGTDPDGFPLDGEVNVFGEDGFRYCKWANAWGQEVYTAMQAGVEEPATLTMRYTKKVAPTGILYKSGDPKPYEIISVNDIDERHAWLEVKVVRKVAAKHGPK